MAKLSQSFNCVNCGRKVSLKAFGTHHRNHCPYCLYSVHLDQGVGDRNSSCLGIMEPIGKTYKKDDEEMIVHQCQTCGVTKKNRVAGDDSYEEIARLVVLAKAGNDPYNNTLYE